MAAELPNPSLVPFVVAVTGHRDLRAQDEEALRRQVGKVLAGFRERMPSTPLLVMSGLAEGADQLVAEVALEQGASVAVVLPLPLEIYKTQMSVAGWQRFEELRAQAALEVQLPLDGRSEEDLRDSEESRAACYEALAIFLARQGQALLALWDGSQSNKHGGTSSVVSYVRSGVLLEGADEPGARCGVVYQIVTPRRKGELPENALETMTLGSETQPAAKGNEGTLPANVDAGTTLAVLEENLERFNRASLRLPDGATQPRSRLIAEGSVALSEFQVRLETLYGQADAISVDANGWRKLFLFLILGVAIAGTLFYGIHGEMLGDYVWLWFSFAVFVITALLLHRTARARHIETQYLDARAFAEALRVQFFWEMAGVKQPVDRYYLVDQPTELDWIRYALKNVWLLHLGTREDSASPPNRRAVLECWVKDQMTWYRNKADGQTRSVHRRERVSRDALLIAVGWSILIPASLLIPGPWRELAPWKAIRAGNWVYQAFHVALAVPALLAGGYRLWIEQAGYEEQSREYRSMERKFSAKAKALETNLESAAVAENLLLELGKDALSENGRWLLLHRERPMEVLSTP